MTPVTANYHTHTIRCGHATGQDRDYVEHALKGGFTTLGFSDHSPMVFLTDHRSGFRMPLEKTADYAESILALREEYKGRIRILLGAEAEYYPDSFREFRAFLADYPFDYLILGQHFLWREEDGVSAFPATTDKTLLLEHCKNVLAGLQTGAFSYVAHPDLFHFVGPRRVYREIMRPFVRELRQLGFPLEINRLGLTDGRHYPNPVFWELAAEEGCIGIIGIDAHDPAALSDQKGLRKCIRFAEKYGIRLCTELPLRSVQG